MMISGELESVLVRDRRATASGLEEGDRGLTIDSGHDKADLCRVRGTSEMGIYLLCLMLVERDESVEDVVACSSIVGSTFSSIRSLPWTPIGSVLI